MRSYIGRTLKMASVLALVAGSAQAKDVEVLHWWTSGGEAAALNVLKDDLQKEGIGWKDMPVAGGGGQSAMTVLRARVTSGDPPTAVQMLGFDISDWAQQGALAQLDKVAADGNWDAVVPEALQKFSKYDGHWVAVPVNVHSTNWVWSNKKMLADLGIEEPKTWDEFIAAMQKVKDSGKIALAAGGQPWQEATMFDGVVLSVGGPDFYKKAFIDLDPDALGGPQMVESFKRMEQLHSFVDPNFSGRDWNLATAMVINGEAAFQMMGDWAKGEFLRAGKEAEVDFGCFRTPGTADDVTFNADQFAMFKVGEDAQAAQDAMAKAVMSPSFQIAFNTVKGSVPSRTDVSDEEFDACGKKAMAQLKSASQNGTLLGSMAHGHADPASVKNAIYDVVTANFNGDYDAETAAKELVKAVSLAQ
ncbi:MULTISPECIES: ABC transporter substrate-binding protein [Thioclava]|uniref:Probable sugar-binding periplasmic protein n=1 Tax=Thioclava nitratireducens TaxID=1915078 RepID=A0ABM6IJX6_9RHOB|nr:MULTISPECIES: ABC transporter substrate-binding protein [Thioclava]AQS49066.1 sugar ABC transporter substrate-binding protein [Thioclava nitratireducens]OWY02990.1 sugar ABC transporter substrate-binding protein [Thioclava sp. IC9]OWY03934.1 sugar ABC transporter substrate-binding protein [Thioclava sp. F1Mire-8]OWY09892.1 sugar ABC transporter substrate-binding protein [Thioclava sp. F42-5]OWY14736.1 sugar ABC transporter substrate-binding protein [Thioclava sp. F34-6]